MTLVAPDGREVVLPGECGYPGCTEPPTRFWTIYEWVDEQPTKLRAYAPCADHEVALFLPSATRPSFELERIEALGFEYTDLAPASATLRAL